ncbi:MAG: hypothetical protein EA389_02860 [Ilumatobacter sp.]|nr:MAG: hypothetical protein EA389_02860 [Ilumatobacter sp.]
MTGQDGGVFSRVVILLLGALALVSCRLDVDVSVVMEPDGTGMVTVVAEADAGLVGQVENLAAELVFDDVAEGGWTIDGPTPTDEGGLVATFTHPFQSAQELANVLNSIGPPLSDVLAGRVTEGEQTANEVRAVLVLPDGFESFADADLIEAAGGLPFADRFAETGATPPDAMSFTLRLALPGEVISSTGAEVQPEVFEWEAPLDGSSLEVAASTVQRPPEGGAWAGPLATAALVALAVWVVLSGAFIVFVLIARRKRAEQRRRRRRPPRPPSHAAR